MSAKAWLDLTTLCRDALIVGLSDQKLEPTRELGLAVAATLIGIAIQFSESHSGDPGLLRAIFESAMDRDHARGEKLIRSFTGVSEAVCIARINSSEPKN